MIDQFKHLLGNLPYGWDFLPYLLFTFCFLAFFYNLISIFKFLMGVRK